MFRQFAGSSLKLDKEKAKKLFRLHPIELSSLLDQAWELRKHNTNEDQGPPDRRSNLPGLPSYLQQYFACALTNYNICPDNSEAIKYKTPDKICGETPTKISSCVRWNHLIYAYMIENTGVYEIFRQVLHEFRHGEELGVPLDGADHWLRNTEELFYKEPASFSIMSLRSDIRPSLSATRRNAYFRMFGMELNHQGEDQTPFIKARAANNEFVNTFEEFLREIWVGIINTGNTSGENRIDDAKISNLAEKLYDMQVTRRLGGNLAREEFWFVSMMSWMQLSLEFNSPIVLSLRADGTSAEQRLHKIAQRVGKPAHALSKNFFDMADAISRILLLIETKRYNTITDVPELYKKDTVPAPALSPVQDIKTIITHWSITTGHDLKSKKVSAN